MPAIMSKDVGHRHITENSVGREASPGAHRAWQDLQDELDKWATAGKTATLWWRDDDATMASPQLERLLQLSKKRAIPICLAVIPHRYEASLIDRLSAEEQITVVQHGYAHDNHAPTGEKKAELVGTRPTPHILAELAVGFQSIQKLARALPVLVPPWNRIADHLVPLLPEIGLTGLSTFGPRRRAKPTATSVQVNTHIDPIAWRHQKNFVGIEAAVGAATAHLQGRREGTVDSEEPTGLLSHHGDMDSATWAYLDQFMRTTDAHPAVTWLSGTQVFAPA